MAKGNKRRSGFHFSGAQVIGLIWICSVIPFYVLVHFTSASPIPTSELPGVMKLKLNDGDSTKLAREATAETEDAEAARKREAARKLETAGADKAGADILADRDKPLPPTPVVAKTNVRVPPPHSTTTATKTTPLQVNLQPQLNPPLKKTYTKLYPLSTTRTCPGSKTCSPLLTGCGRSGTHHLADQIINNGIPVKHERIGEAGSVSWIYAADYTDNNEVLETWFSSKEDVTLRRSPTFQHYPVVLVTRHPLSTISSLTECFCGCGAMHCGHYADEPSWEWVSKHVDHTISDGLCKGFRKQGHCFDFGSTVGEDERKGRMIRSVEYWVQWNTMLEHKADYRMKMEDFDINELIHLMAWDKYLPKGGTFKIEEFRRKSASTRKELTWQELERYVGLILTAEVKSMAGRYGYEVALEK